MLTPIEQTPNLVYDPARQQITPVPVVAPQPLAPLAETPLQKSDTPSQSDYQSGKGSGGDMAFEQKEQAQAAQKLRAAWAYLQQLKSQVSQALSGGNAIYAKRIALEAADVAASIETISLQIPLSAGSSSASMAVQASSWLPPSVTNVTMETLPATGTGDSGATTTATTTTTTAPTTDAVSLIDLARQGLGTAKEVVDSASSIPYYTLSDRTTIDLSLKKVLEAMSNVEAIAQKLSLATPSADSADVARIDVQA